MVNRLQEIHERPFMRDEKDALSLVLLHNASKGFLHPLLPLFPALPRFSPLLSIVLFVRKRVHFPPIMEHPRVIFAFAIPLTAIYFAQILINDDLGVKVPRDDLCRLSRPTDGR